MRDKGGDRESIVGSRGPITNLNTFLLKAVLVSIGCVLTRFCCSHCQIGSKSGYFSIISTESLHFRQKITYFINDTMEHKIISLFIS